MYLVFFEIENVVKDIDGARNSAERDKRKRRPVAREQNADLTAKKGRESAQNRS